MIINSITGGSQKKQASLQAKSVTPSQGVQTVAPSADWDALGSVTVLGDENLIAGNVKSGVNIFGVTGSYEKSTSATYTLGMFTAKMAIESVDTTSSTGTFSYGVPTYTGTKVTMTTTDITGKRSFATTNGRWTPNIKNFSATELMYCRKVTDPGTFTATASTTLPNGTYSVAVDQTYGTGFFMSGWGGRGSASDMYGLEYNGECELRSKMTVSNGTARISVFIEDNNYGWRPRSSTYPSTIDCVFSVNLIND